MTKSAGIAPRAIPFLLILKARRIAICVTALVFRLPMSLAFCCLPSGSTFRAGLSGFVCFFRLILSFLELFSLFGPGPTNGFGW